MHRQRTIIESIFYKTKHVQRYCTDSFDFSAFSAENSIIGSIDFTCDDFQYLGKRWIRNVRNGLEKIANHILRVNPDVVGLQEIENEMIIRYLMSFLGGTWTEVHRNK